MQIQKFAKLFKYELLALRWDLFLGIVTVFAAFGLITTISSDQHLRLVTVFAEMFLPVLMFMGAGSLIAYDHDKRVLELLISLPSNLTAIYLRRLIVIVCLDTLIATVLLVLFRLFFVPFSLITMLLNFLGPAAFLSALGLLASVVVRDANAALAFTGGVWLAEQPVFTGRFTSAGIGRYLFLYLDTYHPGSNIWLANRLVLLTMSLACILIMACLLRRQERLIT